ncbi:FeoA family protein [Desulfothermus okinawensis JCM 13304]
MELKLSEMKVGEKGKIIGYGKGAKGYLDRIFAMGLTIGSEFQVMRIAPLGDPVEISVRGFNLSLRKQEANILLVKRRER